MIKKFFSAAFILIFIFSGLSYSQTIQQTLNLKAGFNFVAFTVKPSQTASEFIASNPAVGEIYAYNSAAGSFLSSREGTLNSLNAGRGYIIKSASETAVNVSGTEITALETINLKAGFNLIGFSKALTAIKFSELMAAFGNINGIYKYNSAGGSFIQAVRNGAGTAELLDGADPSLAAGQSYFFNMHSDALLNYDGGTISVLTLEPVKEKVAAPEFTPKAFTYTSAQTVTISCATPGATVKYTLDGTEPSETNGVTFTQPIVISSTTTLRAIAIKAGMADSYIATANYVIIIIRQAAAPVFSVPEGSYDRTFEVAISSATPEAAIRYTLDWSTPSASNGILYSSPIVPGGNVLIKAYASRPGMRDSDISQARYIIAVPKIPAPEILPPGGTYNSPQSISLSCATEGVTIRYTTD